MDFTRAIAPDILIPDFFIKNIEVGTIYSLSNDVFSASRIFNNTIFTSNSSIMSCMNRRSKLIITGKISVIIVILGVVFNPGFRIVGGRSVARHRIDRITTNYFVPARINTRNSAICKRKIIILLFRTSKIVISANCHIIRANTVNTPSDIASRSVTTVICIIVRNDMSGTSPPDVRRIRAHSRAEDRESGRAGECKSKNSLFHFELHPPKIDLLSFPFPVLETAVGTFHLSATAAEAVGVAAPFACLKAMARL